MTRWEKFYFYLNRFNAVVFFFILVAFASMFLWDFWETRQYEEYIGSEVTDFGSTFEPSNSIIGQAEETKDGTVVAYFEANDVNERKENRGLVLVNSKTSQTLPIAQAREELLVNFEYLYDQGAKGGPVVGYIAKIATEAQFKAGKADLVLGALPSMTKHIVGRDVRYSDMPQVRSDGSVGIIIWQDENSAEIVGFNISTGTITDRAKIDLPLIEEDQVSQGPGRADNPDLLRDPNYGKPPMNQFH